MKALLHSIASEGLGREGGRRDEKGGVEEEYFLRTSQCHILAHGITVTNRSSRVTPLEVAGKGRVNDGNKGVYCCSIELIKYGQCKNQVCCTCRLW